MAYYRGDYYRGDYYRGDYYRGDPFALPLIGAIGKVAGKVLPGLARAAHKGVKLITGATKSPAGRAIATAAGTAAVVAPMISPPAIPASMPPSMMPDVPGYGQLPGTGVQIGTPGKWLPGGAPAVTYSGPGGVVPRGYHINKAAMKNKPFKRLLVKNQRMNVTNPRALRRAIRRGQGFMKLARRIISFYSPKAPKGKMYFGKRKRR